MKIKYQFDNETVEIEVSEEWGSILADLDRQEYNNNHKESRRHYHLDACTYEGEDFAAEDPALTALLERDDRVAKAVETLPPAQRELMKAMFWDGMSQSEYARLRAVSKATVSIAYHRAIKKLREIL